MNIPNILTWIRVALIPIFVVVFYLPWIGAHFLAALIFALGAITDWLDGYLARALNQASAFGKFLDPVADKLMVAVALVLIVGQYQGQFEITLEIPAAIIIGREIVISALREWMAEIGKSKSVAVSYLGKIKTTVQMLSLILLLAEPIRLFDGLLINIGITLLWLAAGLTLWSMIIYLRAAHREMSQA
ncbi:MAG TPA: CDP-diacylglycerol--glycerol-3-phosphate 3-phosphatidyltransferase [Gammaproteobacteria bacterium]|nr:CDP-diacylglycerol--glycerol-3-phosphate 3-phosphatidyltransferase [Gammaproteobacteria bacterium]